MKTKNFDCVTMKRVAARGSVELLNDIELAQIADKRAAGFDRATAPNSAQVFDSVLAQRAARGSVDKFHAALAKVPDVEPEDFDRL